MSRVLSNRIIFLLAIVGVFVSGYLTLAHQLNFEMPCGLTQGGCDKVAQHESARGFGIPALRAIPTAAFGLMMFIALLALSFARAAVGSDVLERRAAFAQWLMLLAGVAATLYLTYLEKYVIQAWCAWCVASGIITVLAFLVSSYERLSSATRPADSPSAG